MVVGYTSWELFDNQLDYKSGIHTRKQRPWLRIRFLKTSSLVLTQMGWYDNVTLSYFLSIKKKFFFFDESWWNKSTRTFTRYNHGSSTLTTYVSSNYVRRGQVFCKFMNKLKVSRMKGYSFWNRLPSLIEQRE